MALIKSYKKETFGKELYFPEAYHKIAQLTAKQNTIIIEVDIYSNQVKDFLIDSTVKIFSTNDVVGTDLIQVGYELLKKLSIYKESTDVFEEGQPFSGVSSVEG